MERTTMQLSDWFTVVTILVAVLAFYKSEERQLLIKKIGSKRLYYTAFILFALVPFLLFYDRVFGYYFESKFTFLASDCAFIVLVFLCGYWFCLFKNKIHKQGGTIEINKFYLSAMNTLPFDELLRLFIKYEVPIKDSEKYIHLFSNQKFFKAALNHNPNFILEETKKFSAETLLKHSLPKIIKDEILVQIASQKRLGTLSVYNQEPLYIDNELDSLVLFQLVDCYFGMLDNCIAENKFDSDHFIIRNHFLPTIFKEILDSIQVSSSLDLKKDAPTYSHKLLNNILNYLDDILSYNNSENESYQNVVSNFSMNYCLCIMSLFTRADVIKSEYLKIQFNGFLNTYFELWNEYRKQVEEMNEKIISEIGDCSNKRALFNTCWKYSDDSIFVGGSGIDGTLEQKRRYFTKNVVDKLKE